MSELLATRAERERIASFVRLRLEAASLAEAQLIAAGKAPASPQITAVHAKISELRIVLGYLTAQE